LNRVGIDRLLEMSFYYFTMALQGKKDRWIKLLPKNVESIQI